MIPRKIQVVPFPKFKISSTFPLILLYFNPDNLTNMEVSKVRPVIFEDSGVPIAPHLWTENTWKYDSTLATIIAPVFFNPSTFFLCRIGIVNSHELCWKVEKTNISVDG